MIKRPLQRVVCMLHHVELPMRHLFLHLDGQSSGNSSVTVFLKARCMPVECGTSFLICPFYCKRLGTRHIYMAISLRCMVQLYCCRRLFLTSVIILLIEISFHSGPDSFKGRVGKLLEGNVWETPVRNFPPIKSNFPRLPAEVIFIQVQPRTFLSFYD